MVYSISLWFRIVFLIVALIVLASVAGFSEGAFLSRFNAVSLIVVGVCLFAAAHLERWTFDRNANLFERDVGILLLYARKRRPLDALTKVVLREFGAKSKEEPRLVGWMSRPLAVLAVVDRDGNVYRLDMTRGGSVRELRRSAERLSAFCAIPLEDDAGDRSARTEQGKDSP
jgi:hypothetical protein